MSLEINYKIKLQPNVEDSEELRDYIENQLIDRLEYVEFGIVKDNGIIAYVHISKVEKDA